MKQATLLRVVSLLVSLLLLASLAGCGGTASVWEDATYRADTTLGEGATSVTVKVTAEDKTVTITLLTDEETLADALLAAELCEGEVGDYGLMISHVNGIRADYDLDGGYWWQVKVGGEAALTGASGIPIVAGSVYELVRTK